MKAAEVCSKAASLVTGARAATHGPMKDNHDKIALIWGAYLRARRDPDAPLMSSDVTHMMCLLKIARTQTGTINADDYVDLAGYAGLSAEITAVEAAEENASLAQMNL